MVEGPDFTQQFMDTSVDLSDYSAQDSASFGSIKLNVIKFGERLLRLPDGFMTHQDIFGGVAGERQFLVCASSTGKLTDLVVGTVEKSSKNATRVFQGFCQNPSIRVVPNNG